MDTVNRYKTVFNQIHKEDPMREFEPVEGYRWLYARRPSGIYYIRRKDNGRLIQISLETTDLQVALERYRAKVGTVPAQRVGKTVADCFVEFQQAQFNAATRQKHQTNWDNYIKELLGGRPIDDPMLREYVRRVDTALGEKVSAKTKRKISTSVRKATRSTMRSLFNFCMLEEWRSDNPAVGLPPLDRHEQRSKNVVVNRPITAEEIVTEEEIEAIKNALGDYMKPSVFKRRTIVQLMVYTGTRINECLALVLSDLRDGDPEIFGEHGSLAVERQIQFRFDPKDSSTWFNPLLKSKTQPETRLIPLTPASRQLLDTYIERGLDEGWLQPGGLLFPSERNTPLASGSVGTDISEAAKKAGIKRRVKSHFFRHTYGSRLFANGATIAEVARLLGNSERVCREVYVHFVRQGAFADRIAKLMEGWQ